MEIPRLRSAKTPHSARDDVSKYETSHSLVFERSHTPRNRVLFARRGGEWLLRGFDCGLGVGFGERYYPSDFGASHASD